jgi:hypothetical protein
MDTSVYSEAKGEYTKQLSQFIVPAFHRFFMETLVLAQQEETNPKRQLWKFQELLSQIPEWNIDKVQRETGKLIHEIQCDYLEELLTAVFIAHTKVLTAIRIGNKNKRVQITVPKLDHFLHRSLTESSRLLWSSVYLFHHELSPIDKQKNHRQIEQLLYEGVSQAIRGLLPVKNILKDYLAEPEHDAETDAEDEEDDDEKDDEKETSKHSKQEKEKASEEPKKDELVEKTSETLLVEKSEIESPPIVNTESVVEPVSPPQPQESITEVSEIPKIDISSSLTDSSAPTSTLESQSSNQLDSSHETISSNLPIPTPAPSTESAPSDESTLYKTLSNTLNTITSTFSSEETGATNLPSTPATPATPATPTLIVATDNSVQFTNFDQVIQQRGNRTHIDYIEKERIEGDENDQIYFMGDDTEPVSDFEELMEQAPETLDTNDFESLP